MITPEQELTDLKIANVWAEITKVSTVAEIQRKSDAKALELNFHEVQRRLDALNHSHELAREKEREFLDRETYGIFAHKVTLDQEVARSRVEDDFNAIKREISLTRDTATQAMANQLRDIGMSTESRFARAELILSTIGKPQYALIGGFAAIVLTLVTGLWGLAISPVRTDVERLTANQEKLREDIVPRAEHVVADAVVQQQIGKLEAAVDHLNETIVPRSENALEATQTNAVIAKMQGDIEKLRDDATATDRLKQDIATNATDIAGVKTQLDALIRLIDSRGSATLGRP